MQSGESGSVNLSTIADHKGALGTVETQAYNTINRTDTIKVGDNSKLNATAINLTTKTGDNLNLNLQSEVFNYSFIPLKNSPNMSLSLNQNNLINVGKGAKVTADEDMTIDGAGTATDLTKSVKYYSTYSNGGQTTTANTDGNEKIDSMTTNNVINVDGTVEAGTYNKIGISITGKRRGLVHGRSYFQQYHDQKSLLRKMAGSNSRND